MNKSFNLTYLEEQEQLQADCVKLDKLNAARHKTDWRVFVQLACAVAVLMSLPLVRLSMLPEISTWVAIVCYWTVVVWRTVREGIGGRR